MASKDNNKKNRIYVAEEAKTPIDVYVVNGKDLEQRKEYSKEPLTEKASKEIKLPLKYIDIGVKSLNEKIEISSKEDKKSKQLINYILKEQLRTQVLANQKTEKQLEKEERSEKQKLEEEKKWRNALKKKIDDLRTVRENSFPTLVPKLVQEVLNNVLEGGAIPNLIGKLAKNLGKFTLSSAKSLTSFAFQKVGFVKGGAATTILAAALHEVFAKDQDKYAYKLTKSIMNAFHIDDLKTAREKQQKREDNFKNENGENVVLNKTTSLDKYTEEQQKQLLYTRANRDMIDQTKSKSNKNYWNQVDGFLDTSFFDIGQYDIDDGEDRQKILKDPRYQTMLNALSNLKSAGIDYAQNVDVNDPRAVYEALKKAQKVKKKKITQGIIDSDNDGIDDFTKAKIKVNLDGKQISINDLKKDLDSLNSISKFNSYEELEAEREKNSGNLDSLDPLLDVISEKEFNNYKLEKQKKRQIYEKYLSNGEYKSSGDLFSTEIKVSDQAFANSYKDTREQGAMVNYEEYSRNLSNLNQTLIDLNTYLKEHSPENQAKDIFDKTTLRTRTENMTPFNL